MVLTRTCPTDGSLAAELATGFLIANDGKTQNVAAKLRITFLNESMESTKLRLMSCSRIKVTCAQSANSQNPKSLTTTDNLGKSITVTRQVRFAGFSAFPVTLPLAY